MNENLPSTKANNATGFWGLPLVLLLLVLVLNEFVFGWLIRPRLTSQGDGYTNFLYYFPWFLRTLDVLFLASAWSLFKFPGSLKQAIGNDVSFNFLLLVFGFLILCFSNPIFAGKFMLLRLIMALTLLWQTLRIIYLSWVRKEVKTWLGSRIGLALAGLFMALLLTESVFFFVGRSHHTIQSYAGRIWFHRHWETNRDGFRDQEYSEKDLEGKKVILCLGDSFTAGAGVADPKDRFSDRLQGKLGDKYKVLNLGVNGLGPEGELEVLQDFPYQADVLLLSWFLNDIHGAAEEAGMSLREAMPVNGRGPTLFPKDLLYSANYFWWSDSHSDAHQGYYEYLRNAFANPKALTIHTRRLSELITEAQTRGMKVAVVLFPQLYDVPGSNFAIQPIETWLKTQAIPSLNLIPIFAPYAPEDIIVNNNDAHPNQKAHALVADTLSVFLQEHNLIK
jgi:lysophospholipase L1-like esterase